MNQTERQAILSSNSDTNLCHTEIFEELVREIFDEII